MENNNFENNIANKTSGLRMTAEQAVQAVDSVLKDKANEVFLESYTEHPLSEDIEFEKDDARFEYLALVRAKQLLEIDARIEEQNANTLTLEDESAIRTLKSILTEASADENSVCYVTDIDAPALMAAISALEDRVKQKNIEKNHSKEY